MTMTSNDTDRITQQAAESVHKHWKLVLVEGIVLVVLGAMAIAVPPIATLSFNIIIGSLLLASGVMGLIATFARSSAPGFWWSLLSAIIAIAAGSMLLVMPISGVISLTLVLIAFFVAEGVASIMYAISHRNEMPGAWIVMLLSGLVDIVLGGMIFAGLPSSAAWAIGLLLGINLIFGGIAVIALAVRARNMPSAQPSAGGIV